MKLYSLYDKIALEYSLPFGAKNDGCAIRIYKDNVKKGMNKSEVKLFFTAEFDTEKNLFLDKNSYEIIVDMDKDYTEVDE